VFLLRSPNSGLFLAQQFLFAEALILAAVLFQFLSLLRGNKKDRKKKLTFGFYISVTKKDEMVKSSSSDTLAPGDG
jgi:hypothetical protein